ncbi:MAG TPA: S8 family serine peptidase [Actinomycetota bacterium]|nr:S8 family serine peptidase [Actinomycetota bacterium]
MTKTKQRVRAIGLGAAILLSSLAPVQAAAPEEGVVPGMVLVRFDPDASSSARAAALDSMGGRLRGAIPGTDYVVVRTNLRVADALQRIAGSTAVIAAEPNVTGRIALTAPNDPCYTGCSAGRLWNLDAVHARGGWQVTPGMYLTQELRRAMDPEPVKVAVLDTRIDVESPDWINATSGPLPNEAYDSVNGGQIDMPVIDVIDSSVQQGPAMYHGTFVAGIVAASANNGAGIAGLGYAAQILPVTVIDGQGRTDSVALATGITKAALRGARVINLSLVLDGYSGAVQQAINTATGFGALVVAAAGNNGSDDEYFPAQMQNVMQVAASDTADRIGRCSNFNGAMSVAAPGVGVVSLDARAGSGSAPEVCGTSTAAPHVSALAALLFAQNPNRTPRQVRTIIEQSADDDRFTLGYDDFFGHGRINADRALRFGAGPHVERVLATVPKATGGTSSVTATIRARSEDQAVRRAQMFVRYGDGSDGEPIELTLASGRISVPTTVAAGAHRIYVRAFDSTWGGEASAPLLVDRAPPAVDKVKAESSVAVANMPVRISFELSDDLSSTATYRVLAFRRYVDGTTPSYASQRRSTKIPATVETSWTPYITDAGLYSVIVGVTDEGENVARSRPVDVLVL